MPGAGEPIGPAERDHLLRDVQLPVAIAVSGGVDSTALMHLVAAWARGSSRASIVPAGVPPVLIITVDHGLRPESAEEAAWVEREAGRLGLEHVTLRWTGRKPRSGVMEAAREARYSLISEHVGREPLPYPRQVLLAHHLDDQAETILMRLARGSGVDGLSGMREVEQRIWLQLEHPVVERPIILRRPLLSVSKSRLEATLEALGADFLQDPSNADTRFERVRLRSAVGEREALGLTTDMLALTARRLRCARAALEEARHALARDAVDLHGGAWASIDAQRLKVAPPEVALRLLRSVIRAFGGQAEPPGRSQLEELLDRLRHPEAAALTLGGTSIVPPRRPARAKADQNRVIAIYREPGRQQLTQVTLRPGQGIFWDRRFYLSVAPEFDEPVRVAPLGQTGFARIKRQFRGLSALGLPSAAAASLPTLWAGDHLIAVPCLSAAEPTLSGPVLQGRPLLVAEFANQHVRAILGQADLRDI